MRHRPILISLAVIAVVVGALILRILWIAGQFRTITPHFAGHCRLIKGPVGPEDLTIDPRTGVAYISAADRRASLAGRPVPGAIFAYDLTASNPSPVNLTPNADITFQPHGLSLWAGKDERAALYVINHPPSGQPAHTVEIFDLKHGALVRRASLTDPLLVMPNDLVAVGFDRFYLTNTNNYPPGMMQTLETFLQLPGAKVVYYADGMFRPALEGLVFPNGINVSADGRTLYVAAMTQRRVLVYDRDPRTEQLTRRDAIFIGSGVDNIEVDAGGNLWIGAHPKLLKVMALRDDPSVLAPAQVFRVSAGGGGRYQVDEIYLNAGDQIAAASVAAVRGQRLLIGQIFGNGFLDCTLG
ncbi:MAG: SMP-30/gluconolactonase/LRE family protein [Candidatus Binatia bacterium]